MNKAIVHYKDRIGQKFGRLTILEYRPKNQRGRFVCQCECGTIKEINCSHLISGKVSSCGCLAKELKTQRNKGNKFAVLHCKSNTRLYQVWLDMKQRCYNPKQVGYKWYGNLGIKVCKEWKNDYLSFEKWAVQNGYKDNLTIDRIDCKGDYEPNNCRWVDWKTQSRNKKDTILITYNGKTQCLKDWCAELKKPYPTVANRIHDGWQPKYALLVPKNVRRGSEEYNEMCAIIG